MRVIALVLVFAFLLCGCAFGVDGVVLLNQSTATAGLGGCDAPGFPITICHAGSYRLSGNLVVADSSTNGIEVTADNVTIDLNGFSLSGPVVCTGTYDARTCDNSTAWGISAFHVGKNLTVKNGTVSGFLVGVFVDNEGGLVDNVLATSNRNGIFVVKSIVRGCNVNNGIGGLGANLSVVTNNIVTDNGGDGITGNGTFTGNTASANHGYGMNVTCPSSLANNTASFNTGGGIMTSGSGCALSNNAAP